MKRLITYLTSDHFGVKRLMRESREADVRAMKEMKQ